MVALKVRTGGSESTGIIIVFLNKEIVTSQDLSHNAILAYVGLRMIMSRDVLLFGEESTIAPV